MTKQYLSVPLDELLAVIKEERIGYTFATADTNPPESIIKVFESANFNQIGITCIYVRQKQNILSKLFKTHSYKLAHIQVGNYISKHLLDLPSITDKPGKDVKEIHNIHHKSIESLLS